MKNNKANRNNPNRKSLRPKEMSPGVVGTLDISKQGMGYVTVPGMTVDIIIKRENLKTAMNGDTVEVSIFKVGKTSKRAEGIITKIVKRGQSELIGTVQKNMNYAFVVPDNKSFTKDIFLGERQTNKVKDGDKVIVRITSWDERQKNPEGEIVDILTGDKINDIAMKEILLQAGFRLDFPEEVLEELQQIPNEITNEEIAKRKDLRDIFTLTIDPHDAKDFDDAISYRPLKNGLTEIGVHIADVAHYIKPNSALDAEAYSRATSVYLPDRVLPMLPEKISNELCSLRPKEDKLTFSVLFQIDDKTQIKDFWIGKTIIHSDVRLTYEDAQQIIDTKEGKYSTEILHLHSISQILRKQKFEKGAINFSSEEARFILDEHGVPTSVVIKESQESHQLIEELMLLANRTVAEYVHKIQFKNKPVPFPYRIHDSPDIERLKPYAEFAATFGHKFNLSSPEAIAKSFNQMILNSNDSPDQDILHTLGIRTMAKAIYSTENIGHYGLAFEYYCHFTSPIRRYPDVLVHRILLECLEKEIHPIKNMEQLCTHCSDRERKAMEAEREGAKYKQVEFMQKYVGEEFDATISGVAGFGFWAQTNLHRCEGFISTQNLLDLDEFTFVEEQYALVGKRTMKVFQIGKSIKVRIVSANLSRKQIDLELV
jgi:ribonuclease R